MTPDEIRSRCRKVHLIITDNAIFPAENSGIDNSFVPAFRTVELAERNRRDRDDFDNMIRNAPEVYGRTKTPKKTLRTMAFYLVPASKIDTDKPQG